MAQCRTPAGLARHPARCPASGNGTAYLPRRYGGLRVGQGSCSLRDQDHLLARWTAPPPTLDSIAEESVGECEVVHIWRTDQSTDVRTGHRNIIAIDANNKIAI